MLIPAAEMPDDLFTPARPAGRRIRWRRAALLAVCAALAVIAVGCVDLMARAIVYAPNHGRQFDNVRPTSDLVLAMHGVQREMRVDVGPPSASLCVWIVEPRGAATASAPASAAGPRGTILVLHGHLASKIVMTPVARSLADAGYRAVLVDLRGHGSSSGDWLTFGAVESRDLSQVVDALEAAGVLSGPLGVYGASYGGGIGIQFAGRDKRVRAVVAVAPFESLRAVVPTTAREFMPAGQTVLPDDLLARAVDRAGEIAGFDPDDADTCSAIRRTDARVLILHGVRDGKIPIEQGRDIAAAAPLTTRLVELPSDGHFSIMFDITGTLWRETRAWFDQWLAPTR